MKKELEAVIVYRQQVAFNKEREEKILKRLEKSITYHAYLEIVNHRKEAEKILKQAEEALRENGVKLYNEVYKPLGQKKIPGGSIRVYTKYEYKEEVAMKWAVDHDHEELILKTIDKKNFEPLIEPLKLDFAKVLEDPRMSITSKIDDLVNALARLPDEEDGYWLNGEDEEV